MKNFMKLIMGAFFVLLTSNMLIAQDESLPPVGEVGTTYDQRLCTVKPQHNGTECQIIHPEGLCSTISACGLN
ncbi:hypothetical protein MM236_10600 [Belliella sp. DSM 107340]|uniref:Secreted protein n=1 Tax=Belliella calami TaxID=2923436 RepID=A0ABS9UP88_9BACT|nr:hypothetical protein [Belliella calami]MCH7398442.1 hypothetical protein [Belliella calami]